jgi:Fe-S-cluster containining protein
MRVDLRLLAGLSFRCRPGCGLCCYASPAVSPAERDRLITIVPTAEFREAEDGYRLLAARENGGACSLLEANRCRAHAVRPFPCRVYPVHTHLGLSAQASVVMACPGVDLSALSRWGGELPPSEDPVGFDSEIRAADEELRETPWADWRHEHERLLARLERRLTAEGRWEDPEELRRELFLHPPGPDARGQLTLPPPESGALEELPVFFDPQFGRVALRSSGPQEYSLETLLELGGPGESLGRFHLAADLPELTPEGARMLRGYVRYLVVRDHFFWAALHELRSGAQDSLRERLRSNLVEASTEVLRRATVRGQLHGESGQRLGPEEVLDGVRAVDAELLDRPTLGRIL